MLVAVESNVLDKILTEMKSLNEFVRESKVQNINEEVLDTHQAAEYLKISERTVQTLRNSGDIKYFQCGGKILYKKSELEKFLENYRVGKKIDALP